ncbi:MAG: lipocalin-like domain-containing protein [Bacteroidaceae bacterium]|nr:lipocalin-like domain-containing protein [Bacteroidaceae bacterium]
MIRNSLHKLPKVSLLSFLFILCLASCDKVPANGALDGLWQLMSIETPGGIRDAKDSHAYLSIQLHLAELDCNLIRYYAHFSHEGDSLFLYDFVHQSKHRSSADDNAWVTPEEMSAGILDDWGIHTVDARFRVNSLNGSSLILQASDTTLTFRKL